MTGPAFPDIAAMAALAIAGLAFGLVYFRAVALTAGRILSGAGPAGTVALVAGRLAGAAMLFALAAWLGAGPLVAAFAGFLVARAVTMRRARRAV